jgi:hypothetical protein
LVIIFFQKGLIGGTMYRKCRKIISAAVLLLAAWVLSGASGAAAVIPVGCSTGELIAAINSANGNGEANTLTLAENCSYTLTAVHNAGGFGDNGLPQIQGDLTVVGRGATLRRDPAAPEFRFFQVNQGASLTLEDLHLINGRAATQKIDGGALSNEGGSVVLIGVSFTDNYAGCGGALYNHSGYLAAFDSAFSHNTADA